VKRNGTKRYICETKRNETNQNDNVPKPWKKLKNPKSRVKGFGVYNALTQKYFNFFSLKKKIEVAVSLSIASIIHIFTLKFCKWETRTYIK
jgi:hypothetical protein